MGNFEQHQGLEINCIIFQEKKKLIVNKYLKIIWNFYEDRCFILKLEVHWILSCCCQMIDVALTKIKENIYKYFKTELIFVFIFIFLNQHRLDQCCFVRMKRTTLIYTIVKKLRRIKLSMFLRDIDSYWLESICI